MDDVLEILIPHLSSADRRLQAAFLLLERIRTCVDDDNGLKTILRALALHTEPHPAVTEQVVQLLHVVDAPEIVIDVLAQIVGPTAPEVEFVVSQYKQVLDGNRSLLVPILGSLADLVLTKDLRSETFTLAHAAVSVVDEEDLPSIARALLRVGRTEGNRTNIDNQSVRGILRLRESCVDIDPSTEFLVVQVFHQSWMTDPKIAHHFLTMLRGSIAGMKESQIGSTLSSLDVSLLLLLMINPSYRTDAQWCATVCLSNKSLGYSQLEEAVHRSKEPEWRQLGPAILEMLQVYLRVVAEAGWGTDGSRVYVNWIRRLLSSLYRVNREMRTPIIHTLIALVERSVRSQQVGGGSALFSQQSSEGHRRSYGGNETSGGRDKVSGYLLLLAVACCCPVVICMAL